MGWYERNVFTRILEYSLANAGVGEARARTLAHARGDILEVGLGTGMNLSHYPDSVRAITSLSPDAVVDVRAQARARTSGITLTHIQGDGSNMPFDDDRFDTVVSILVLCTIPDIDGAVREYARVLRPGGRLLFFEHVVARRTLTRTAQRFFEPVFRHMNCGCSMLRDIAPRIERNGFSMIELRDYRLQAMPPLYRRVIHGAAMHE